MSRLEASSRLSSSPRLSDAILNKTLTKVAALLDSCFKRLGGCRIKPEKYVEQNPFVEETLRTNSPKAISYFFVCVEASCKLIAVVQHRHQAEEMF